MTITDEELSAYIDGSLEPDALEAVAAALEVNSELQARLSALRAADAIMMRAARELDERPMPQGVLDLLASGPQDGSAPQSGTVEPGRAGSGMPGADRTIVPFQRRLYRQFVQPAMGLAASLFVVAGFTAGWFLKPAEPVTGPTATILTASVGVIDQQHPLYLALSSVPSGETATLAEGEPATVTPVLSFLDQDQRLCREMIAAAAESRNHLLACRTGDTRWTVVQAVALETGGLSPDAFTPASAGTPAEIDAAIDARISGSILSKDEERAYLTR